jgi:hypothetical protein
MIKKIIKQLVFILGLLVILIGLSYFFANVPAKLKGFSKQPDYTLDYLAFGDSECAYTISPMEIWKKHGYSGYNSGVPGQRLQDTYYQMVSQLKSQSPKVILLETNAFYRDFNIFKDMQGSTDRISHKIFPVFQYHNRWKNLTNLSDFFTFQRQPTIPLKGLRYNLNINPYTKGPYVYETSEIQQIPEMPLYYLNKIRDLCNQKHIQLILFTVPSPVCWTYEKHNGVAAYAKKNHLLFLDLNLHVKKIGIDWNHDTKDAGNHLNFYGAIKATDYIGHYLSKHTELTDHRKDKSYKSWKNALKKYKKMTPAVNVSVKRREKL